MRTLFGQSFIYEAELNDYYGIKLIANLQTKITLFIFVKLSFLTFFGKIIMNFSMKTHQKVRYLLKQSSISEKMKCSVDRRIESRRG